MRDIGEAMFEMKGEVQVKDVGPISLLALLTSAHTLSSTYAKTLKPPHTSSDTPTNPPILTNLPPSR